MSKNIWIINEYTGSPEHGMNFRHYYLGKELVKQGNSVTVITASNSHLRKKVPNMGKQKYKQENIDGINYLWIKVIKYSRSFEGKRVLKWFQFAFRLMFVPKYINNKPDIIICSPTAPFSVLPAYRLAKKFKTKLVFETRDIWPLTLIELGGYSKKHPFIIFMQWFETFGLKKADVLVSNLPHYNQHLLDSGINRDFIYIPKGVDLDEFKEQQELDKTTAGLVPKDKFVIGYTGTLGIANAIDFFIDAAVLLKERKDIVFVIVGNGQEKERLIEKAAGLDNVIFIPSIPKLQIQPMLKLFDVCYIGLLKQKLFKYGVSPNKLFDYMLASRPVLYAIDSGTSIVEEADCGVSVEAENSGEIADGLRKLYNIKKSERDNMGSNGKAWVLKYHDYSVLAKKYLTLIK